MATAPKPAAVPLPQQPVGFGTAISATLGAVVHTASAIGKVAETADVLAGIGLDKAQNMRASVAIQDAMTLAVLRSNQAKQLAELRAAGVDLPDDLL